MVTTQLTLARALLQSATSPAGPALAAQVPHQQQLHAPLEDCQHEENEKELLHVLPTLSCLLSWLDCRLPCSCNAGDALHHVCRAIASLH